MPENDNSKLLLDEPPLIVLPRLAMMVGLHGALFLQQIHYWMQGTSGEDHEGRRWIYNSYPSWQEQFPFLSIKQIRDAVATLESMGVMLSSNYNKLPVDNTKWYTINYEELSKLEGNMEEWNTKGRPSAPQGRPSAPQGRPTASQGPSSAPQGRPLPETSSETTSRDFTKSHLSTKGGAEAPSNGPRLNIVDESEDPGEQEEGSTVQSSEEHFENRNDWPHWEAALRNAGKANQKIAVLVAFLKENRPLEAETMGRGLYSGMGRYVKDIGNPMTALRCLFIALTWNPDTLLTYARTMHRTMKGEPRANSAKAFNEL